MKKVLFTLAMVLMGTMAHAQSIDKFISQFEGNNDAQVVRMDKNMIKFFNKVFYFFKQFF